MSEVKRAFSRLCDKGFPIKGGVHYGTQSLGMIPSRLCDNASSEEAVAWKRIAATPAVEEVKRVKNLHQCILCGHHSEDWNPDTQQCALCGCHCVFPTATPSIDEEAINNIRSFVNNGQTQFDVVVVTTLLNALDAESRLALEWELRYDAATATPAGGDEVQNNSVDAAKGTVAPSTAITKDGSLSGYYLPAGIRAALLAELMGMLSPPLILEGDSAVDVASWFTERTRTALKLIGDQATKSSGASHSPERGQDSPASSRESSSEPAPESQGVDQCTELHGRLARYEEQESCCWHCKVVLADAPKLRCEDCPDECDEEGCDEDGCVAAREVIADKEKQNEESS